MSLDPISAVEREADIELEPLLLDTARRAGKAILEIYEDAEGIEIDRKADDSPLTQADLASHRVIVKALEAATPGLPVLSEESAQVPYATRKGWGTFWLVDPLDGTKEFIKRNGEFTVNIALVHEGAPVLGIVHAPGLGATYLGGQSLGAFLEQGGERRVLEVQVPGQGEMVGVVVSRSHLNEATEAFVDKLEAHHPVDLVPSGSSLKFCRIAEGSAHVYPRLAPTMEWDTGAAQAVLEAAGGLVVQADGPEKGQALRYNKEDLLNPRFVAAASTELLLDHGG